MSIILILDLRYLTWQHNRCIEQNKRLYNNAMGTAMSDKSINLKVCTGKRNLHAHVKSKLNKINESGKS